MNQEKSQKQKVRPFVLGVVLTDEWAASPNMGEAASEGATKVAKMKVIKTSEGLKTILSGQAVGSWHRQTLYDRFGWKISELQETVFERDTRSFYTQCQPIEYEEDDGRGYMAAVKLVEKVKEKVKSGKEKEREREESYTLTTKRTSPFMLSQFQSVAPVRPTKEFGILARNLDDLPEEVKGGLIFQIEVAAAAYAGLFALNLSELGCFSVGVGRDLLPFSEVKNLVKSEPYRTILQKRAKNTDLSTEEQGKLNALIKVAKRCVNVERGTLLALSSEKRQQRAHDLIAAIAELEGGAHLTRRLYNVAPATALIAFMDGGNCLPPHIFRAVVRDEDEYGNKTFKFEVDVPRLWKVLKDNAHRLLQKQGAENFYNIFFGTLGAPSIENEEEVKALLEGKDPGRKLPETARCKICDGPREAIRTAASALLLEWFTTPGGAMLADDVVFGEKLLDQLGGESP